MIPSLSEIQATSKKATRGAGLSWGLAEEAARATVYLWRLGFDGPSALAHLLQAYQSDDFSFQTCPLFLGSALCDTPKIPFGQKAVISPLLILPFAAEISRSSDQILTIAMGKTQFCTTPEGLHMLAPDAPDQSDVTIINSPVAGVLCQPAGRRAVTPEAWKILGAFEHNTYAPATEASRLAGAGAGLSDND